MDNCKSAFDAIFDDKEKAENLKQRSELLIQLEQFIKNNFTQSEAEIFFEVPEPMISDIMNGNIDKFTVEELERLAAKIRTP